MGKLLLIFLLITFTLVASKWYGEPKKCRALVLEGGGDQGSYQIGVLKAFVEKLAPVEVQYDVVTGVSVGSINAMAISLHKIGEEKQAIEWMEKLWMQLKASDIYTKWPLGLLEGVFFEEGLWDNTHQKDFLRDTFNSFTDKQVYRRININTVDFDSGDIYKYNETTPWEDLPKAVVASTSMPFAFPHTYLDDHVFVDGGTIWNIDLSGAIERCFEIVDDPSDIIIDTILCNTAQKVKRDETQKWNTVNNFFRYLQISSYYSTLSDYYEIMRAYPKVNFRYLLVPESDLPSSLLTLDFIHEDMVKMMQIGYDEASKAIDEGEGSFKAKLENTIKEKVYKGLELSY